MAVRRIVRLELSESVIAVRVKSVPPSTAGLNPKSKALSMLRSNWISDCNLSTSSESSSRFCSKISDFGSSIDAFFSGSWSSFYCSRLRGTSPFLRRGKHCLHYRGPVIHLALDLNFNLLQGWDSLLLVLLFVLFLSRDGMSA